MLFIPHKNLMNEVLLAPFEEEEAQVEYIFCQTSSAGENTNQFKPENQFHYKTKIISEEKRKLEDPVEFS